MLEGADGIYGVVLFRFKSRKCESLQLRSELPTLFLLLWVGGSGMGEQVRG